MSDISDKSDTQKPFRQSSLRSGRHRHKRQTPLIELLFKGTKTMPIADNASLESLTRELVRDLNSYVQLRQIDSVNNLLEELNAVLMRTPEGKEESKSKVDNHVLLANILRVRMKQIDVDVVRIAEPNQNTNRIRGIITDFFVNNRTFGVQRFDTDSTDSDGSTESGKQSDDN